MSEGYIKFVIERRDLELAFPEELLDELNRVREILMEREFVGVLPDGVGYGNISVRVGDAFFITASATGALLQLESKHWIRIDSYSLSGNRVRCSGRMDPSSESMSHAAVYDSAAGAKTILHIHSKELWIEHIFALPSTPVTDAYGTPAMARSIMALVEGIGDEGVITMGGHKDGLLAWASDPTRALALIQAL